MTNVEGNMCFVELKDQNVARDRAYILVQDPTKHMLPDT